MASISEDSAPPVDTSVDEFLGMSRGPMWRRWLKWLAIAIAVVVLTILIGRFVSGGVATEYLSEPVVQADMQLKMFGSGRLQPTGARMVTATQRGMVQEILVADNQPVEEGQVLARLDQAPFQEAIDRARELLDTRQAAVGKAAAARTAASRQLALYQQVRRQSGGTVPSDREMAAAQQAVKQATDALGGAQTELVAARDELSVREAQLAGTGIRAPITGVVTRRLVNAGQVIGGTPGQNLFVIAEPYSRLRLEIATDRVQANRLREVRGARAIVTGPSGKGVVAPITQVAEGPAPPQPARGPATPVPVGIALEIANPGQALRPGTVVTVQIALGLHRDALVVPNGALRFARASDAAQGEADGEAVYIPGDDGKPYRVPVVRGGSDGRNTEVTSDSLRPGMRVITGLR